MCPLVVCLDPLNMDPSASRLLWEASGNKVESAMTGHGIDGGVDHGHQSGDDGVHGGYQSWDGIGVKGKEPIHIQMIR